MKVIIIKNIFIKINGLSCRDLISIYDGCSLIYKNYYNGLINICLDKNKVYKIVINTSLRTFIYSFIASCHDRITFNIPNNNIITFRLTDSNYLNLPIERGELLLWEK